MIVANGKDHNLEVSNYVINWNLLVENKKRLNYSKKFG